MFGAIPNPKKTVTVDLPIEEIKVAARNIDKVMSFCHFREENEMFNSFKFSRTEFLSLGAFININLTSINSKKTQVDIEISRQLGAFDEWVEIQKANKHIEEAFNAISYIVKNGVPEQKIEESSNSGGLGAIGWMGLIGLGYLAYKFLEQFQ